jgi:TPR repeat protein
MLMCRRKARPVSFLIAAGMLSWVFGSADAAIQVEGQVRAGSGMVAGEWGRQDAGRKATSNDPEQVFWRSIMNSESTDDYRAYLSTYPSGKFAALAKARLSGLGGGQPAAGDQSSPPAGGAAALRQGAEAFKAGDYAEAWKAWRSAAQAGSPPAMVLIGDLYYFARGVPKDYSEAMRWYRMAADQGNALAQANIGYLYQNGKGVPQDYAQAMQWYRMAADAGSPVGQNYIGDLYYDGQGVAQDYAEAMRWYRMAADQGNAVAQANIGHLYENGEGVPQDYAHAMQWYRKAAEQGNKDAKIWLAAH